MTFTGFAWRKLIAFALLAFVLKDPFKPLNMDLRQNEKRDSDTAEVNVKGKKGLQNYKLEKQEPFPFQELILAQE